ncbi:MAG: hypothetical protein DWI22_21610 [Planctomycetota bacterium]|nr:MAG: hypothetical protein DWI22_21610 [Planctomycetota bacterium]
MTTFDDVCSSFTVPPRHSVRGEFLVSTICTLHQFKKPNMRVTLCLAILILSSCPLTSAADPIRLTTDGHTKRDPVFLNAQGTELLYVVLDKPNQLRLMKLSLADQAISPWHMSETRSEFEPAVSTSGRHIAFVQNRGNLSLAMVIEDLAKTQVGEVPPGGGFSGMHSPTFTRDDLRVFFSYPEEGRQQIFSVNLKGEDRRTVIDSEGVNNWPQVSPDGRQLVFSSSRDNDYEVYLADIDGSNPRRLTRSPGQDLRPRFSPEGSRIAFTSNRDGNYEIYVMKLDATGLVRLTNNSEQDDFPLWDPDGRSLIVVSERDGQTDLYRIATSAF